MRTAPFAPCFSLIALEVFHDFDVLTSSAVDWIHDYSFYQYKEHYWGTIPRIDNHMNREMIGGWLKVTLIF